MFLVRWICWLASLPLVWLGQGAAMLGQPVCVPLLKRAWLVGGDGTIALAALARIAQHVSAKAARSQAAEWLARRPQTEIAAYAGMLALGAGETDVAREMFARAQQLGPDRGGMLEVLELLLADADGDAGVGTEVARRLALRDDLSPAASKLVYQQLLWDAMFQGRLDEVRQRAEHVLSIEDDPLAATAMWLVARRDGRPSDLGRELARFDVAPVVRLQLEVLGHLAAGELEEARRALPQLRQLDARAADHAQQCIESKEASA